MSQEYASKQRPGFHAGAVEIAATGSTLIDLGIRHNNFFVTFGQKQALADHTTFADVDVDAVATDITVPDVITWSAGDTPGTFYINATVAAATVVHFIALEEAAV